jgi:hypothetical protein
MSPLVHGKQDCESYDLKADVGEENRKDAMNFAPEHSNPDSGLQDRVGHPEHGLEINDHQPVFGQPGEATVDDSRN